MNFDIETRSEGELVEKLQKITLRGGDVQPFKNSYISIEKVDPITLSPCQRYALKPELRKIEQLRWEILKDYSFDILQLNGYLKVKYEDTVIDIIPVVVEEFISPRGEVKQIINDGLHRAYLSYQMGSPLHVAYVRGVNKNYPYYAWPLPNGWDDVEMREGIPKGYVKKFHVAKDHKFLYRNFNSQFENIGDSRPYNE